MKKVEDETPLLATGLEWENLSKSLRRNSPVSPSRNSRYQIKSTV